MPNARVRELCGAMKGVHESFSYGSAVLKEWGMLGLLNGFVGSVWKVVR